jgi:hypothetical protein
MRQPTLYLTVGLPSTGKTTAARRPEVEQNALRLTKDEWVKVLYGDQNPPSAQGVIEGRLIQVGLLTSRSQRPVSSMAPRRLMNRQPDSRHGASGAVIAGRSRSLWIDAPSGGW